MKIKANLQIYKSKKRALFYIPIKYEKQVGKFLNKHVVVECIDCKPSVKFVAKICVIESDGYFTYSLFIPKRFLPKLLKFSDRKEYTLILSRE